MMDSNSQTVIADLLSLGLRYVGVGNGPFDARPWVPISSQLTHIVYLFTVLELLSWLQKRIRPSDPGRKGT